MKKSLPAFLVALAMFTGATAALCTPMFTGAASAQVTPLDDDPNDAPGLGSIVGSPDAGPAPDDAGDRGGAAQLGVAVGLLAALGFIAFQIWRSARRGTRAP